MRLSALAVLAALFLSFMPVAGQSPAWAKAAPESFADLADSLLPAVVNISSTQKAPAAASEEDQEPDMPQFPPGSPFEDFFNQFMDKQGHAMPAVPAASLGSGFIIDAEKGYIITNNHVIKDANEVRVTFHDNDTIVAEVLGRDEKTDLAVLKVKTDKKLTAVKFGDSDKMRVGDWILAIGNPFGLGGTVTAGIVSARQRDINSGPYDDFIQTDASINRGNSGGPMFNMDGKVIGINTAIFSPSGGSVGIGFAIPSSLAKPVLDQIVQYGHTRRGWLGVRIQSMTPEIAESLGLKKSHGALVASVTPKGPAGAAGVKAGDVILKFNGQDVDEMRKLPRLVAEAPINAATDIVFWHDGKEQSAKVTVGELEKAEKDGLVASESDAEPDTKGTPGTAIPSVGLTLKPLNDSLRRSFNVPEDVEGVVIDAVKPLSEGAIKGLAPGDVVVEINQQPAADPKIVKETIEKAQKDKKPSILLLINHEGDVRFVALKLGGK